MLAVEENLTLTLLDNVVSVICEQCVWGEAQLVTIVLKQIHRAVCVVQLV